MFKSLNLEKYEQRERDHLNIGKIYIKAFNKLRQYIC